MSSSLIEYLRSGHDDIECLELTIVSDLKKVVYKHTEKIDQSLRVSNILDKIQSIAQDLKKIYKNSDNSWNEEIQLLSGRSDKDFYSIFYERLNDVISYHNKNQDRIGVLNEISTTKTVLDIIHSNPSFSNFNGEEGCGLYLDLHVQHTKFINSSFGHKCCYSEYVKDKAWSIDMIVKKHRISNQYALYLSELVKYLESFYCRSKPLGSLKRIYQEHNAAIGSLENDEMQNNSAFDDDSTNAEISSSSLLHKDHSNELNIDFSAIKSSKDLELFGGDKLKLILKTRGFKSSGSICERAERLWRISKGLSLKNDIQQATKLKVILKKNRVSKEVALNEMKLKILHSEMQKVITRTFNNIIAKSTKTREELENELEENNIVVTNKNDKEFKSCINNPLKLPLGPDGKPIPFWLYKLHGLNLKFECEICGNFVYEGRRAFEKHFNEPRHQLGMRALGIPNSRAFYEISKIDEANDLWNYIRDKQPIHKSSENLQEFEDDDGNLYDRITYELLKKQALI